LCPDISLSTDIVVGFPSETKEDFNDTMDLIRRLSLIPFLPLPIPTDLLHRQQSIQTRLMKKKSLTG
jgi:hypothetical protein